MGDNGRVGTEHYFSTTPQAAGRPGEVSFSVAGRHFQLRTMSGVFSATRLDPGTAVLLAKAAVPDHPGNFLDLGCGYGPISCVLATLAPQATVYAVDVNSRARELTRGNVAALGLAGRVVVASPDEVPAGLRFDQIWSNPPIRIGKAQLHQLMQRWLPRLTPQGQAWLVVARHLGGDSLADWLTQQGYAVRREASRQGFRVLRVTPAKPGDMPRLSSENV
jgi:16S rRNA G1207 methylase RsmC